MRACPALVFTGAVLLAAAAPAPAQTALSGQVDLARLLDLSAQRLNLRIVYDEQALKSQRATLRQDAPLSDEELWLLTNHLLADSGFTTIRAADDGTISVVKLQSAAQQARVEEIELPSAVPAQTVGPPKPAGGGGVAPIQPGFRRVLVRLKRASVKDSSAAVQIVLSKSSGVAGTVVENEAAGALVIADLSPFIDSAISVLTRLESAEGGADVREFPLRNLDPARAATLAKSLADKQKFSGGRELRGEVFAGVSASTVLIVAPPAAIPAWEAILSRVDQREPVERRTYSVTSFGLKEVATLIEQSVRAGGGGGGPGPSAGPAGPSAPDDRWKVISDDLTGSLIIDATSPQHDQIASLLDRLASIPAESRRPVRTFKIRNRAVREMQQVLLDLLNAGVLDAAGAPTAANAPAGAQPAPPQSSVRPVMAGGTPVSTLPGAPSTTTAPTAATTPMPLAGRDASLPGARPSRDRPPSLTLTCDEPTNTLIAVGEPRTLAQIAALLPTLDIRQPQVMLEAFLVSLSDSQSLDFGVELERLRVNGSTIIKLSSLFGFSSAVAGGIRTVPDRTGFTGSVLDPGEFSVVVRALEGLSKGRSLSSPKILVNNNQQATFNSVLQQPFASTNASTTVATTAFGGTQDAGTTISVKPQIAEGDHLVLDYTISLSSFVGAASSANLPPPRQQNSVQSIATIPDGYTVIVGGLELNTDGNSRTQVPLVGDIPLIGELFKSTSTSRSRSRFYVFLRASVLRGSTLEDLKYLSEKDVASAGVGPIAGEPEVRPQVIR